MISWRFVIISFKDQASENIFNAKATRAARRALPLGIWPAAARKLDQLDAIIDVAELQMPPGNKLKQLSGSRKGQHSIRINRQCG